MPSPKVQQLIALADELSEKMNKTVALGDNKPDLNLQFEAQRKFGRDFYSKLRRLSGELEGDIFTLKARDFDPNMMRLLGKVKMELEKILLSIKESNPHGAAQKLVDYVQGRSTKMVLDNLDFLAQHHLQSTMPPGKLPPFAKHVEVNFFKKLRALADELKAHMDVNPPLYVPSSSSPPRENPAAEHPVMKVDPDAATKIV